jgi:sugar phosphate isomerase/epimerase
MQLGFVSADRRYAGVTHLDVTHIDDQTVSRVRAIIDKTGVALSGLGYYPNSLHPDPEHCRQVIEHLRKVISAAPRFGVRHVNTFVGRNPHKSVAANWPSFLETWPGLVEHAAREGVMLGIENCPMLFSEDEWPGGANLATTPAVWNAMFQAIPSKSWGLNFDPSHLVWQHIDAARCVREFGKRIVHFHAKDTRIDPDKVYQTGSTGLGWHDPKLPGLGEVAWGPLFAALTDVGYQGPVCIEVEDRAFEGELANRKRALVQSKRFLEQFVA